MKPISKFGLGVLVIALMGITLNANHNNIKRDRREYIANVLVEDDFQKMFPKPEGQVSDTVMSQYNERREAFVMQKLPFEAYYTGRPDLARLLIEGKKARKEYISILND